MPGLPDEHPKRLAMRAVIESPEGEAAIVKAAKEKKPSICGVDSLLRSIIVGYGDTDDASFAGQDM